MEKDVSLKNIVKSFDGIQVLKNINLDIKDGEIFSILGPSGCGKTTLLRMIAGFTDPDEGAVYLGNEDITKLPPNKRNVNTIFQKYALFPHLSVYENVAFPLKLKKVDKKTIDELLALIPEIQYIDVIGKTNIMQFIEVISRASLVVTNDTSAYHIAVATQRPTVMICGGYTYTRYAHYNYATSGYKDPVLANYKMDCYNCNNRCKHYGFNVFPCIEQITKEETWKKVKDLIVEEKI